MSYATIDELRLEKTFFSWQVQFYGIEGERYYGEAFRDKDLKSIEVKGPTRNEVKRLLRAELQKFTESEVMP